MDDKIRNETGLRSSLTIPRDILIITDDLPVQRRNILRSLGMQESDADEYLTGMIDELSAVCRRMLQPRAAFSVYEQPLFQKDAGKMLVDGRSFHLGGMVSSFLKNSELIAVFAATCGPAIERFSKKLIADNQALEGYLVDLIASELAEGIAEKVHDEIESLALSYGFSITNRYSPGYCNWPVSDQRNLFSLLQGHDCGIEVAPSSLMLPVKSVSGLVGMGRKVKRMGYKCRYCADEKCLMRGK